MERLFERAADSLQAAIADIERAVFDVARVEMERRMRSALALAPTAAKGGGARDLFGTGYGDLKIEACLVI